MCWNTTNTKMCWNHFLAFTYYTLLLVNKIYLCPPWTLPANEGGKGYNFLTVIVSTMLFICPVNSVYHKSRKILST